MDIIVKNPEITFETISSFTVDNVLFETQKITYEDGTFSTQKLTYINNDRP